MAYRVLGRAGPPQPRRARRLLFAFTLSLSCTYLCYSLLGCCDDLGQSRLLGAPRCLRGPGAGGQKLLQESRPCDPSDPTPGEPGAPSAPAAGAPSPRLSGSNHSGSPKLGTKRLPQALIVGVKKGGTRAVLEFIRVHPDVRALGTEPTSSTGTTAAGWTGTGKERSPAARPGSTRPPPLGHLLRPRIR